jgi:hypothetical protein
MVMKALAQDSQYKFGSTKAILRIFCASTSTFKAVAERYLIP